MFRIRIRTLSMVALGVCICSVGAAPLPDRLDPSKAAQQAILDLSNNLDQKDVVERARKIVREHDSEYISSVFQRVERGGLGLGDYGKTARHINSIQGLITFLQRQQPPADKYFVDNYGDLLRSAKVMQAMSELAPHRVPNYGNATDNRIKEWAKVSADFKTRSQEFRLAVESKNPIRVRDAARHLNHTCCDCHGLIP